MRKILVALGAGLVGGALLAYFLFADLGSISQRELRTALRDTGDSAVAAYRTSGEMQDLLSDAVGEAIRDTVKFYEAEVRAAAVVEIRRDTVTVSDTTVVTVAGPRLRTLRWDPVTKGGVTIFETNYFEPGIARGTRVERSITLGFQPDTLALALLRLDNGIERMSALLNGTGEVVVINAAVYDPGPTTFDKLSRYLGIGGCVVAGFQVGRLASDVNFSTGDWIVAGVGGVVCGTKLFTW
jgi:hypothetical protein